MTDSLGKNKNQKKDIDIDTNLITLKELSETLGIAERTVKKGEKNNEEAFIWVGPSLVKQGLSKYKIFKGELPKHITEFLKEHKVKDLMVSIKELPQINLELKKKGSKYEILGKKILKELGGR